MIMTEGGSLNETLFMALFIYKNGFKLSNFGYAAASSLVLFLIIIITTLIQFKLKKEEIEY